MSGSDVQAAFHVNQIVSCCASQVAAQKTFYTLELTEQPAQAEQCPSHTDGDGRQQAMAEG